MLISHKNKFITIDIPKTGSRSLRETLYPLGIVDVVGEPILNAKFYQHGTADQCAQSLLQDGNKFSDYFSFCLVRNPWDRYFSFFKYFKTYAQKFEDKDPSIKWGAAEINQGKYCVSLFNDHTNEQVMRSIIINHQAQSDFFTNQSREVIVNHIASFENINEEFEIFCKQIGIQPLNLKHGNKSKNFLDKKHFFTNELIDLVADKEELIIKLKGYKF
jgi:hypothetical protein